MKALVTFGAEKRNAYKRRTVFVLLIVALFFIQSAYGAFIGMRGVRVFLLIPAVVAITMYERGVFGAGLGLFAGALWDITLCRDGFAAVVLFSVAAICSVLVSYVMRNNIITGLFLSAVSTAVYILLYIFVFYISEGIDGSGLMLSYLPAFLITTLVFPAFYYLVRQVTRCFTSGRASYVE